MKELTQRSSRAKHLERPKKDFASLGTAERQQLEWEYMAWKVG